MSGKKNKEKWERVRVLLLDAPLASGQGIAAMSDRTIAAMCNVSPTFVGMVRKALVDEGKLQPVTTRKGFDGRRRHLPRTPEEKEQLRKEKERLRKERPKMKRGPTPFSRRKFPEGSPAWKDQQLQNCIKQQVLEQSEVHENPVPLPDDFADRKSEKARHGKGRVNRKPGKEEED